jgi:hypothetical protein
MYDYTSGNFSKAMAKIPLHNDLVNKTSEDSNIVCMHDSSNLKIKSPWKLKIAYSGKYNRRRNLDQNSV